ncbi:hypothetical protein [Metallosphaera sp.]|uniref:hypothetical protein n=1 Tax=Metallosphaera sp. TaxID=2020860 RepID=UPI003161D92D
MRPENSVSAGQSSTWRVHENVKVCLPGFRLMRGLEGTGSVAQRLTKSLEDYQPFSPSTGC